MPTTPGGLRYPASSASPNVPADIQNLATDTDSRIIPRYATTTARDTGIPSPVDGQVVSIAGKLQLRTGGAWMGLTKGVVGGIASVGLSSGGDVNITHGLGATPTMAWVQVVGITGAAQYGKAQLNANPTSTILPVRVIDTRDGSSMASFGVTLVWGAFLL